ncbi:hypothetical protein [Eastern grey kangaroopox virus]|uniref:Uncharacterized protein n=1 Tax=Eastern grey kangaroopox virus TaxID=2042482 RepID=A0A2C9DT80_9POXV|nr:hypothetical protein KM541_gp117 [Eastern grey kangaroopox virus]ATI21213.1 hypothetical protein [Eastern grey kangaroopox virus]AXK50181.1 hypothetical protein EKPV-NSW-ORF132 [Eastern grey kangaroopox virus]
MNLYVCVYLLILGLSLWFASAGRAVASPATPLHGTPEQRSEDPVLHRLLIALERERAELEELRALVIRREAEVRELERRLV